MGKLVTVCAGLVISCFLFSSPVFAQSETSNQLANVDSVATLEDSLLGDWEGTWKAKGSSGPLKVSIARSDAGGLVASYKVKDKGKVYQFQAAITIADIVKRDFEFSVFDFNRVDSLTLENDILSGKYTFKGKAHGSLTLEKVM